MGLLQSIRGGVATRVADRDDDDGRRRIARGRDESDRTVARGRGREDDARRPRNVREQLPPQSQAAQQLRAQLTARTTGDDQAGAPTAAPDPEENRPRRQAPLPAVRATDTRVERRAEGAGERPGRLERAPANPAVQTALDRFASLRNVGRTTARENRANATVQVALEGVATSQTAATDRARANPAVQAALDRIEARRDTRAAPGPPQVDENAPQRPTATATLQDLAREIPNLETLQARTLNQGADATIRLAAVQNQTTPRVAQPTAEQISRANTTEEIRENLQADSNEIQRGLTADADAQSRQNLQQTAESAAQGSEARRESRINSNERQARELRSETRELEQDLRSAQRDLRDVQSENRRLQGTPNNTASTAANLANRVNILAA